MEEFALFLVVWLIATLGSLFFMAFLAAIGAGFLFAVAAVFGIILIDMDWLD